MIPVPRSIAVIALPKTTPTNVVLAQILQIRRLFDKPINLYLGWQIFTLAKVSASQLLLDPTQHLQRPRILHFLGIDVVVLGRRNRGPVTGAADDAGHLMVCRRVHGIAHDGLAALRRVVWFRWRSITVVEAPRQEGIMYELCHLLASNHLAFRKSTTYSFQHGHDTLFVAP